jgi:hypothetical protein
MSWGDSLASIWNSATEGARAAASAIATGAKAVADSTAAAVQFVARETKAMLHSAAETAKAAGEAIVEAAKTAAKKTAEATEWALQQGAKAARAVKTAAIAAKDATVKFISDAYEAAKVAFSKVVAGAVFVTCALWNELVAEVGEVVAFVFTKLGLTTELLRVLLRAWGDESQKPFDGHVFGAGCQEGSPTGVMPKGCFQKPGTLPKITYVNGINTRYTPEDPEKDLFSVGICKTMQEIANTTCSEVTGVYNATEGMGRDLDECLDNIAKNSNAPSVITLRKMMVDAARTGQPMTLYAHSQGGLITQEAVAQAKQTLMNEDNLTSEEAERRLGVVSIKSFGTAMWGWPSGPHYERFTNTSDPVPRVIAGAQTSYPWATWSDSALAEQHHVFTDPHASPIDSHSMDDTYLPKLREIKGAPHCACQGN